MSGHTPGPWFYEEDDHAWMLFGGNGIMPMQLAKCPKKGSPYAEYWPEEADARLIAAAPEFLEVCKELLRCWHEEGIHARAWDEATEDAERAIAKAEGKDKEYG